MMSKPTDSIRSCRSQFVLYLVMIVLLLFATRLRMRSQLLISTGTNEVTQALRFSAIMIMEQNEYQAAQWEEQHEEEVAARYHHAAHHYSALAKEEGKEARRSRTRSDYYEYLTEVDVEYENITYHKMLSDDHIRLELLQNISQEEDKIAALRQEENEIQSNSCSSWFVFENYCTMLRIIPDRRLIAAQKDHELQTLVDRKSVV